VPMNLRVRFLCPVCGGRGELWPDICGICMGTGDKILSHQLRIRIPAGVGNRTLLMYSVTPPLALATQLQVRINIS